MASASAGLDVAAFAGVALQCQQRSNQLQAVADAVIDLAHQRGAFVLPAPRSDPAPRTSRSDAPLSRRSRIDSTAVRMAASSSGTNSPLASFDDVVERTRLERGNRKAAVLRAGNQDDGRVVGNAMDALQRGEAVHARHVVIERDCVELLGCHRREGRSRHRQP